MALSSFCAGPWPLKLQLLTFEGYVGPTPAPDHRNHLLRRYIKLVCLVVEIYIKLVSLVVEFTEIQILQTAPKS